MKNSEFYLLGVRSLANASRARQFNPLNPLGWGGYRFLNQIWQPWSVVRGRVRSCVVGHAWSCAVVRDRARSCAVVRNHARSCAVVRAWSVMRGRSCVVGRAWSVVRGRAWSCVVVRGRSCAVVARTNERTTYNNPLNPPGVGWVNLFYFFKVRVSIRTCVPNLGSFRRPYRKICLSSRFYLLVENIRKEYLTVHPPHVWLCLSWLEVLLCCDIPVIYLYLQGSNLTFFTTCPEGQ